ncbi:hypothetical protein ACJMK2_026653 [Sinanodonta woodiana]|uniref:Uncharacterized protein n=1 Tax=Sinanodonta woodiana TaxID=1069815 RepID=A0ABD3XNT5_SINWO
MDESSMDEYKLYKKEFYILWFTGINEDFPQETVAVCSIDIDDGSTSLIRVFHSEADDVQRAEDKLLEWLSDDPYINSSSKMDIEIFLNHSPTASFSHAFVGLKDVFDDQEKDVTIFIRIVRVSNVDDEDSIESMENREGLCLLNENNITLSPVSGKDWTYLREVLRENRGLRVQNETSVLTRTKLANILNRRQSVAVRVEPNVVEAEIQTDETGGKAIQKPNKRRSSSSSSDN